MPEENKRKSRDHNCLNRLMCRKAGIADNAAIAGNRKLKTENRKLKTSQ